MTFKSFDIYIEVRCHGELIIMEKYAVDLDKVLDELEFNEDHAEQLASALNKRTANGTTPHIGYGPATRKASAPSTHYRRPAFEPINLADADFAAAPQPSASYIEKSYTSPVPPHCEGRHSSMQHWQQNGVSTPHIGSMFSSLSELMGENKNDLKTSPSLWIHKNLADGRNTSKGKTEKRNGSLDVFISNVTLNSGGHVSECSTTDSLYYNEINKSAEILGENGISGREINIKKNNMASEAHGHRIFGGFLSKNLVKSDIVSGMPGIVCEPFRASTDGLECQTSESDVLGVDISCEAEGLDCNSSNPYEEQSIGNCSRIADGNDLDVEVVRTEKTCKIVHHGDSEIVAHATDFEGKSHSSSSTCESSGKELMGLSAEESVVSVCDIVTVKNDVENLSEENSETQNVFGAVTPAIGFTSFADISDEELQQYLQELEEEVGNEIESLGEGIVVMQKSRTDDISIHAISRSSEEKIVIPEVQCSENLNKGGVEFFPDNGSVCITGKSQKNVVEVMRVDDSSHTAISDVNVMPAGTGPPSSTIPAVITGPAAPLPVSVPFQAPTTPQKTANGITSQDSASALPQPSLSVPLPNTTTSDVLPAVKCGPSENDAYKNKTTPAVPSSKDGNIVLCADNVSAEVVHSEPCSPCRDAVVASTDVSSALNHYVSSNTVNAAVSNESTTTCSGSAHVQETISIVTEPHSNSLTPHFSMTMPSVSIINTIPADDSLSSKTVADASPMPLPPSENAPTSTATGIHGQDVRPENEVPSLSDLPVTKNHGSNEEEMTVNDKAVELLSEVIAASPPSYQSVIEASKSEGIVDRDGYISQENNPFPRSEVRASTVKVAKEAGTIDVLGEEEKPSRPHFLHLPAKINLDDQSGDPAVLESPPALLAYGPPGETPSATPHLSLSDNLGSEGTISSPDLSDTSSVEQVPSDSLSDVISPEDRTLGKLPPYWVPDADAPSCMLCDLKFTVIKRRHHCRACGKVLCSKCCNLKSRLEYLDNAEARVCQPCFDILARVCAVEQCQSASGSPSSMLETSTGVGTPLGRRPNPNNPMEYCSTIPPLEQAASTLRQPPPSVLVPVGVLKREGSTRSKSDVTKQVMFSDGIRPGGDLTELDGSSEPRLPYRRPGRVLKRVGTPPGVLPVGQLSNTAQNRNQPTMDAKTNSFIPEEGLPPIVTLLNGDVRYEEDYESAEKLMAVIKSETELPVMFALNKNYFVQVKILSLDCCVNRTCWCFSTLGLRCVGQDEVLVVLECQQGETTVPRDVFLHLNSLFQEASRGVTVGELGYSVVQRSNFLGSLDHGGFIYVRPSFQCLNKLVLPPAPYLVAILVHRWEMPWARLFPIRLMLRLGAEFRYYPCMLVSVRQRKPVYCEIGHTIMNLLVDFRNLSYTLPSVRGLVIHMEDRQTLILLPKNRYDQVMRALNNSNDHVLAFAANFSQQADSHLVCIQGTEDESYHTQAINIHTKPRKVTGASFVVFNGALKSSLNLTAKSSIVEDGLMVQITADNMVALRTSLRKMVDFTIGCGPSGAPTPDELVLVKWVDDDKNFNVGVRSCIDGKCLDGVPSIRVHNGTDYVGSSRFIRWTEVFIIQSEDGSGQSGDPLDISRLSESIAQATCLALVQQLDSLAQAGLAVLAVRANIHQDNVGYDAGSGGEKLAPVYMNSLDNELVPVLHKAASSVSDSPAAVLELVFHVMLQ